MRPVCGLFWGIRRGSPIAGPLALDIPSARGAANQATGVAIVAMLASLPHNRPRAHVGTARAEYQPGCSGNLFRPPGTPAISKHMLARGLTTRRQITAAMDGARNQPGDDVKPITCRVGQRRPRRGGIRMPFIPPRHAVSGSIRHPLGNDIHRGNPATSGRRRQYGESTPSSGPPFQATGLAQSAG